MSRVEDFEDRVLDLALDLGGQAQIWRSSGDADPQRVVRGVILCCAPGQESTSLLISPEGSLIGLMDIEAAETAPLDEPSWCFVKTQFGSVEGHVALVELLAALKREFIPDLEVTDEGEYWESRDLPRLVQKMATLRAAIDGLADGLRQHGLSREAAEDPEILVARIARIAEMVRRSIARPSEHAPPEIPDDEDEFGNAVDSDRTEPLWDEMYKQNRRTQERMHRHMEEHLAAGEDYDTAFEHAMADIGLPIPADDPTDELADINSDFFENPLDGSDDDLPIDTSDDDEDWSAADDDAGQPDADTNGTDAVEEYRAERHPLLERASQFWLHLHNLFRDNPSAPELALQTLFQGAGDLCGGLAQALRDPDAPDEEEWPCARGLSIVQLKRALRGIAFIRGALFQLGASNAIPRDLCDSLHETLRQIENDTFHELGRLRDTQ